MPETKEYIDFLEKQNATLMAQIESLTNTVNKLNERIKELEEQLGKNSGNSSKPPSSDGLKKKPVNKNQSLRKKTGKKAGGQKGHEGKNLSILNSPNKVEKCMHSDCINCKNHEQCMQKANVKEKRHVVDAVYPTTPELSSNFVGFIRNGQTGMGSPIMKCLFCILSEKRDIVRRSKSAAAIFSRSRLSIMS